MQIQTIVFNREYNYYKIIYLQETNFSFLRLSL
jgi:hypothetical protein